jgi:hypothetical protein
MANDKVPLSATQSAALSNVKCRFSYGKVPLSDP